MSAFDDEFGLFGDDEPSREEDERRSTLGARTINAGETIIDDIEPEEERPARRRPEGGGEPRNGRRRVGERPPPRRPEVRREKLDPAAAQARAGDLLLFLAKKLVSKPDAVKVVQIEGERGPVIELEVDPDDLGKVIGRGGRVAQALRTLVRAGAEGRVSVDIVDSDQAEFAEPDEEDAPAGEPIAAPEDPVHE